MEQLSSGGASSRAGRAAGHCAGPGAGMPRDALQSLPSWSSPETMSMVKETPRDDTPMPDRHFSILQGTFLHFN